MVLSATKERATEAITHDKSSAFTSEQLKK
jgi:hypothetical protein